MDGENLIYACFGNLILINAFLKYEKILKKPIDICLGYLATILSIAIIYGTYSCTIPVLDIGHFLYSVYLILVAIFSNNITILTLNILMLIIIITSRKIYNGCLLSQFQKREGYFVNLNNNMNLDWNYIFPIILSVSLLRLILN